MLVVDDHRKYLEVIKDYAIEKKRASRLQRSLLGPARVVTRSFEALQRTTCGASDNSCEYFPRTPLLCQRRSFVTPFGRQAAQTSIPEARPRPRRGARERDDAYHCSGAISSLRVMCTLSDFNICTNYLEVLNSGAPPPSRRCDGTTARSVLPSAPPPPRPASRETHG